MSSVRVGVPPALQNSGLLRETGGFESRRGYKMNDQKPKTICFDPDFNNGWLDIYEQDTIGDYSLGVDAVALCTDDDPFWFVEGKLVKPSSRYPDRLRFEPDWSTQTFFVDNPFFEDYRLTRPFALDVLLDSLEPEDE